MSLPKSVTRINKNGIRFISNVDRASYSMKELSRAALKDVSKLLKYNMAKKVKKLPGMKKSKRFKGAFQGWVRSRDADLQMGIKHNTWYGVQQELGTHNQPKRDILRSTVHEHLAEIEKIEAQYMGRLNGEPSGMDESEGGPE